MYKHKNKRKKMKVLFSVLFFVQLHCMEVVCDPQLNEENINGKDIITLLTYNTIKYKNACICNVKTAHLNRVGDKEMSPRSTLNVLVNNKNPLKNDAISPLPLKHCKNKQKSGEFKIKIKE